MRLTVVSYGLDGELPENGICPVPRCNRHGVFQSQVLSDPTLEKTLRRKEVQERSKVTHLVGAAGRSKDGRQHPCRETAAPGGQATLVPVPNVAGHVPSQMQEDGCHVTHRNFVGRSGFQTSVSFMPHNQALMGLTVKRGGRKSASILRRKWQITHTLKGTLWLVPSSPSPRACPNP